MIITPAELINRSLKAKDPYLDLRDCGLTDYDFIKGTTLDILLSRCVHLKELILSDNNLTKIPLLDNLSQLKELNLYNNRILEIKGLENLSQLSTLDLSRNQITNLKGLQSLHQLNALYLSENQIIEIKGLESLTKINKLDLSRNHIVEIRGLENLSKLKLLSLYHNRIAEFKGLDSLTQLHALYISYNKITEIKGLENLHMLNEFDLSNNNITELKNLLFFLKRKYNPLEIKLSSEAREIAGKIEIGNNPITTPPSSVINEGTEAILRFYEKLATEGEQQVYEAKLILAGSGESGKTSLSWRLNNKTCPLPKKDERTKEVEVSDYIFPIKDNQKFTAHIWDFGGQQIVHHFHRLFMNENALYLLLTETSRENDDFDYWLQTIQLFGGDSPILFIQNKRNGVPRSLNIQPYKTHFNIIENLYEINLLNNEGLEGIERAIQHHIQNLPIVKRIIPKPWFFIRKEVSEKREAFISYAEFVNICNTHNLTKVIDIQDVGDFLHNLGIVFWYKNNPLLRERLILDKHWATKALFQLIFNEKINSIQKGYFTTSDAQTIWDTEEYRYYTDHLIALMIEFKLTYKRRNKANAYIIPALLPPQQPAKEFVTPNRVIVEYRYTFMPRGIVNYLTAEMSDKIEKDENVWSEGFWLKDGNTEARIIENRYEKFIRIEIAGAQHREFFGAIKDHMDNIHREYKGVKYELKIPCICSVCKTSEEKHLFNYHDIINRIEAGRKTTIECVKSTEDVVLRALLDYVLPLNLTRKKKIFISYSKKDTSHQLTNGSTVNFKEELETHLQQLKRLGLANMWSDTNLLAGDDWDASIIKEMVDADIVLFLVSANLIGTDYVWNNEMPLAKYYQENKDTVLIPIILNHCAWESIPVFSKNYAVPLKGKAVIDYNNRDEAYHQIISRVKEVLENKKESL